MGHQRSLEAVFGLLEPRILLAAQPVVTISDATAFIGESGSFSVTVQNVDDSTSGGRVGFQPYVDLIIPKTGADGKVTSPQSLPLDGVTFQSASLFGATLDPVVVTFDATGKATHPFARDSTGNLRVVNASDYGQDSSGNNLVKPGDQLVVLDLPFGSLVPEQPEMKITVNFSLSNYADLGVPLPVFAQGGFAFGRDALDNPTADHPVLGVAKKANITPSLFTLSKTYNGPEGETATGPNFPKSFTLNFDVATGQTVLNPVFKDTLPDGVVVDVHTLSMNKPGPVSYDPTTRVVTFSPDGPLTGVARTDVTATINFYVGQFNAPTAPATPVLDPATGAPVTLGNNLSGSLGWIPIDPRDRVLDSNGNPIPVEFSQDPSGFEATFQAKSIATQKGVGLHTDRGASGVGPADTLQYTINIQVSDYFEFENLTAIDTLSDGQTYVAGSAKLTVTEGTKVITEWSISSANSTGVKDTVTGKTPINFNISQELIDAGLPGVDGILTGGRFGDPNGTKGPTEIKITYQTIIDSVFVSTGKNISQGDSVSNSVTVKGDIRNADGEVTQIGRSDNSGDSIGIATGSLSKEVYAINGTILTAPTGEVRIKTYDEVTYRITYNLPQSILGKLEFTDFLPLPIFDVRDLNGVMLNTTVSAVAPAVNQMKYGPLSGEFKNITASYAPTISLDVPANSFTFSFNNINPTPTAVTTADFLFTVRVQDDPFGDGLKLTNQVTSQEFKHGGVPSVFSTAIKQVVLTEPNLQISKGVIQTDNDAGTFTLDPQGPVSFTEPGLSGNRFTGKINSTNLALKPINSDLGNIDGGDLVSFAIVVENKGSGSGGAFDVRITDTLPTQFSIPSGGLNLRVTDGEGTPLAYTLGGGDFFVGGLTLIDGATGALKPFDATSGQNIAIITYDLISNSFVQPRDEMINTAKVENYAAREGGTNYIIERGPVKDTATVTTAIPQVDKVAIETSLDNTLTGKAAGNPNLFDLAIGETITYEITATLPEGNIEGFNILDVLEQSQQKLTYLPNSASVIWIGGPGGTGSNLFTDAAWTNPLTSSGVSVGTDGTINFGFGTDVYNRPDNLVTDADRVKVRLTAFVPNVAENVAGQKVTNTGIVEYKEASGTSKTVQDTEDAEIVEPIFDLKKDTTTSIVERGDQVIYTVTLKNAAVSSSVFSAPAFDVTIDDGLLPGKLTLVPGTAQIVSAGTTATASVSEVDVGGNMVVRITSAEIMPDKQIQFQYTAVVSASVEAGTNLVNTVTLKGDSHPMTPTPPDQRPYSLSATETVTVKSPTLSKTVAATSIDETGSSFHDASLVDLAIGEVVTYRITVTAPEAVTKNFKVVDTLPFALQGGFKVLDAKVEVGGIGSNLTIESGKPDITWTNTTATFDFGTVTANAADRPASENQIKLEVKARVEDVAGVIKDGAQAINEAKLTFGTSGQAVATATVDIVEPKLQIVKAVTSPNGFVKPGETVDYTVTVSHLSTSTAPAFDLKVEDLISDPYLALVAGSVSINRGSVVLGNGTGDTTLRVTADKLLRNEPLAAGDVWTISFKAKVLSTTPGGATITNAATSSFDSAPGPGGRPDGGNATASIPGSPSLEKTIISTSNPDTGSDKFDPTLPDLTIGEKLTYRLVLTLPQGLTQNVSITDLLPTGLTPLDARLVSIGTGLSTTAQSIGFSGQSITATFGNVTNSTGAPIGAEDRITIEVDARVKDLPGLVAGDKLTNAAQANFTINGRTGSFGATASAEVVEAKLAIDKQVTPTIVSLGETFTYSVVLTHQAASTAPAYTIMVQDLLTDPNLQLQAGSVTSSAGTISTGNGAGDKTIKVNLARLMPGEVLSISFQAKAISMPLPDGVAINTATFNHLSTPESLPSGFIRSGLGSDSANIQIATPSPKGPEGSPLFAYDEVFRRVRYGSFELPIILAGTADPGSSVGLEIKDATGAPVSVVGITADVGGHWMAPPIFTSAAPNEDLDARAALRSLAGRETAPMGETRLSQPLPAAWLPTTTSAPYTVVTSEAVPAFLKEVFRRSVDVTFNGVIDSEGAVTGDPRQSFLAERSTSSTWSSKQAIASPGSVVWNNFARDFAVSRQMGR